MTDDALDLRLTQLDEACRDLAGDLTALRKAVAEIRRLRRRGRSVADVVRVGPGVPARREVRSSWSRLNQALHAYRAELVRSLVEDEGMSITDTARLTGNARQVVSRLYHSVSSERPLRGSRGR